METSLVGTWTGVTGGEEPVPLTVTFTADGSYAATQTLPDYPSGNTSGEAVPVVDKDGTPGLLYVLGEAVPEPLADDDGRTRQETVHGTYTVTANRIEARLDVPGADAPTVERLIFAIEDNTLTLRDQHQGSMTLQRVE